MEIKTKFQYTYFIYPYMVKKNRYLKYIQKLIRNSRCSLKVFDKTKDSGIYSFFSPKIRNYMFPTFNYTKSKMDKLNELSEETRAAILSKHPCVIFEYNLAKDIQGKTEIHQGIFFKIQKLEIICFSTGICFLSIKTNIEDSKWFSDVLNFNYKFSSINSDDLLSGYDNIRIQTDYFEDTKSIKNFIYELTGNNHIELNNVDVDTQKFLTFSYTCIDQAYWSEENQFEKIKSNYIKYVKVLPNDNSVGYNSENIKLIDKWNYAKIAATKPGVTLFTSSVDMNNYTILPHEFENQYLYTYVFALYIKIYLKVMEMEFKKELKHNNTRKTFIEFTKTIWVQEVSNDDIGAIYFHTLKEILEIDNLYYDLRSKYDILYKELKIEKNMRINIIIVMILGALLFLNILNYIKIIKW